MNRNKRIIDCTPGEIYNLGKQLIDYFFEKEKQYNTRLAASPDIQYAYNMEEHRYKCEANGYYPCEASDLIKTNKEENV